MTISTRNAPAGTPPAESSTPPWPARLREQAAGRIGAGLHRQRREVTPLDAVRAWVGDRECINFCGNDYLGLAHHPDVLDAMREATETQGVGAGASALVSGYGPEHRLLEEELAEFLGRESVLLCSSGYLANLGVITALAGRNDVVVQDRSCHASLIDAARLSGARLLRFAHRDVAAAERRLGEADGRPCLVVTDGVFSMDGDIAPVAELAAACARHGAWLMVDDAHGIGVTGEGGRGCVAGMGLSSREVPVLVGTLGKAFGGEGAFIAGDHGLIDHLVNHARSYIYDTALAPALAAAARAALPLIRADERRQRLRQRIATFRAEATRLGDRLIDVGGPIQPLVVGGTDAALAVSNRLLDRGYLVPAIRPPTVPEGTARLRITLSSEHEDGHIEGLVQALAECLAD